MGDIPFETSPNLSVFSKIWFGSRSQRPSSRNHSGLTSSRPRFHHASDVSSAVRAPLYHPSPVARSGSRCRFPRTALVPSLLLEDCSSVKKNTTPQAQQSQGVWLILSCANAVTTVEILDMLSYVVIPPTNRREAEEIGLFNVRPAPPSPFSKVGNLGMMILAEI